MAEFLLKSTYLSGPCEGRPQYFRCWTVIGPAATPDLAEAERFASAQDAMQSPAFTHWSSFYEPEEVPPSQQAASAAATNKTASPQPKDNPQALGEGV